MFTKLRRAVPSRGFLNYHKTSALFAGDGFVSRGARTLREARSGGYGVWVRTFFGICERGVAVAILCQPRGRAGGATGKVGHRRVPSALLNRMCELPLANSRRKHPLAMCVTYCTSVYPGI